MIGRVYEVKKDYQSGIYIIPKGMKIKIISKNEESAGVIWDYMVKVIDPVNSFLKKGFETRIDTKSLDYNYKLIRENNTIKKL
ncbi:MAG: hypothetical protein ACOC1O_01930 [bacterium]